jgi:hypothetical protein
MGFFVWFRFEWIRTANLRFGEARTRTEARFEHAGAEKDEALVKLLAYQNYREWYMVGTVGKHLESLAAEGIPLDFTFVIGKDHESLAQNSMRLV